MCSRARITARSPCRPILSAGTFSQFHCQGVWNSVDYGLTWSGPINSGHGGTGSLAREVSPLHRAGLDSLQFFIRPNVRGTGVGFWKSTDGGVSWTNCRVRLAEITRVSNAPVVNPYDPNHLLMTGHQRSLIVQSFDGDDMGLKSRSLTP